MLLNNEQYGDGYITSKLNISAELACSFQFECERLRRCSPVDRRYVPLALVPNAEEREGGGGGGERVVVTVEEGALFDSQFAEGSKPLSHSNVFFSLNL